MDIESSLSTLCALVRAAGDGVSDDALDLDAEIVAYVVGLEARIEQLKAQAVSRVASMKNCLNCEHEKVVWNGVPCFGCRAYNHWEARESDDD